MNNPKIVDATASSTLRTQKEYFAKRQLKQGAVGWLLLVGLGVAYVISGDFAGWNFGLAQGGWGGMFIATAVVAVMYLCMCLSMSEMATMLPTAGGGYSFARTAFGPFGGYLTGTAILIEYSIAPAAIACFIGAYCESLFGVGGWIIYLVCYLAFMGIHLKGAGEALKIIFVITAIAAVALLVFIIAMIPHFNSANLFNIAVSDKAGASAFLPMGYLGIWAAVPYAIWFFLAVEGVPLAAEEAKDPTRSLPRGLIGSMLILAAFALLILFLGAGAAGANQLKDSGAPLVDALVAVYGEHTWLAGFVNFVGLAGLIASFFSIIYAYSRQIFALSRAGYMPTSLSLTNKNKAPYLAIIIPGVIGFALSLTGEGDLLILMAVFGATISYVLMMLSHIKLRLSRPDMDRPYKTPGGILTSGIALILALIAVIAGFLVDPKVWFMAAGIYIAFIVYFLVYSRHRLVQGTPEEEFENIRKAEQEL
ncbi:ethanolamine permease [Acinetobacter radioresistens]|uniref:Ethanolamine permease n=1 Tax=Acinetobacter radioresistens SK82 TaxID=596318 RepID=A0ABP2GME4_ACIRA|nr:MULTISPECIES: ethanolamine permease [Acinetobacter]EET82888.1 ethanolamine permease [Acinetobacter radioresistens SK82]EEY87112.1 ethanolamine permease [Acinetobacter radioresistens SH164]ENV84843.1 ethanolamine permease [Acinetobacter radioresistens NIPH 2130]MBA5697169.1 ethanolamine permease [Acinetobacter radioresistens]MBA5700271.1 ethanolamine permease [Acinetobacter radioresistens]